MFSLTLLFIACACMWAITSRKVPTGVLGTLGLMLIACGCFAELDETPHIDIHLRVYGMALVAVSMIWRYSGQQWWQEWSAGHIRRAERAQQRR